MESGENNDTTSHNKNLALGIIGTSFLGTIALISPFVLVPIRSPLPYMATPRYKVEAALKEISRRYAAGQSKGAISGGSTTKPTGSSNQSIYQHQQQLNFYDLGSGDGETVLAAASLGWKAKGIELNTTLFALSNFRKIYQSPLIRQNSRFVWGDFWSQNISDANAVMIFGVKPLMSKIAQKIQRECRPNTYIMAYRFRVPLVDHDAILTDKGCNRKNDTLLTQYNDDDIEKGLNAEMIYDVDEMRIYELRDNASKR